MSSRYQPGEWVCMFGKVTARHGDRQCVVRVGSMEITMSDSELWTPDKRKKRDPLQVPCPFCLADVGEKCRDKRSIISTATMDSFHRQRK